ncbi:hypothetical protein Aple_004860 [Acrocarpospora pleiomorpha]|jgi:hypothetical protein|uniref:Uncharacterized protein n=1 Tax=Acrocarpospora pleiomorpha TaxID=90975 RepID=A0A5M3XDH3_9ACTN|nr:hypothetical protein [Acrocarpospora pleiomorpha]GES17591.1 hypothetical protein Aple_004860 [Acrocarpospora pleiomorpha]
MGVGRLAVTAASTSGLQLIANEREHISKSIAAVTTDSDIGAALTVRPSVAGATEPSTARTRAW